MRRWAATAVIGAVLWGGPWTPASAQTEAGARVEGRWTAGLDELRERGGLRIVLEEEPRGWNMRVALDGAAVGRMLAQAESGDGAIDVEVVREAGVVRFTGRFRGGGGSGDVWFSEDPGFREAMRARGLRGRLDDGEVLSAALLDVGPRRADELAALGFERLDIDDLFSASIFRVDRAFVDEMASVGFTGLGLEDLVAFRVFDVDADFVREARTLGLGPLDHDDIVAMKVHGLTPRVIEEAAGLELGRLDFDDLMATRIHGVDADYVRSIREFGIPLDDVDEAIAFRIHGVTAEWLEEMRDLGFEDLDGDEILRLRIHGFDDIVRTRRRILR